MSFVKNLLTRNEERGIDKGLIPLKEHIHSVVAIGCLETIEEFNARVRDGTQAEEVRVAVVTVAFLTRGDG